MKRFKVGIVGYGWAALAHIPAINASPLAQVTAICSARPLDAAALAAQHVGPLRTFTRYEDLLRDPEVTRSPFRSTTPARGEVIAAAKARKHICEKPLALSWKDVRAVERAGKKGA